MRRLTKSRAGFIAPQLCLLVEKLPEGGEWIFEIKWDGYRAQAIKQGTKVWLLSRNGEPLGSDFPELLHAIQELRAVDAVVDAEVIAIDEQGRSVFQQLQQKKNRTAPLRLVVFDLLSVNGRDITGLPLTKRRQMLKRILPKRSEHIIFSGELEGEPTALLAAAKAVGLEGIVAKRKDAPYLPGDRKGSWLKCKTEKEDTVWIGGYLPNGGSFDELQIGVKEGRKLRYVASMKAGFVPRTKAAVMDRIKALQSPSCPFYNLPETGRNRWGGRALDAEKMKECRWVKPSVKVDVAFVEWTEGGKLRHPRFVRLP